MLLVTGAAVVTGQDAATKLIFVPPMPWRSMFLVPFVAGVTIGMAQAMTGAAARPWATAHMPELVAAALKLPHTMHL